VRKEGCGFAEYRAAALGLVKLGAESTHLALMGPTSRTVRRSLARTSCSPMEPQAKMVKVGGSSGGVPPVLGTRRAYWAKSAEPDAPAEYRRRLWSGNVCTLGWPARGLKRSQPTVRVATLLPNPSLERRPTEAGHPSAAQGSRKLHCPARRKGALPRRSPQLER